MEPANHMTELLYNINWFTIYHLFSKTDLRWLVKILVISKTMLDKSKKQKIIEKILGIGAQTLALRTLVAIAKKEKY